MTPLTDMHERVVRTELSDLLESAAFRTSKRCRSFLEYVVDRTLKADSESLKERSIGIEVFQLRPDFDAGQHTIVRVTANEVRKRLAQHYLGENGNPRIVRIEVPPGSYRAEFRWDAPPPPKEALASEPAAVTEVVAEPSALLPVAQPTPGRPGLLLLGSVALALLTIALLFWRTQQTGAASPASNAVSAATVTPTSGSEDELRIVVGGTSRYLDRSGRLWGPDRFFTGGNVLFRPSERVMRTLDPDLYRHTRSGEFRYDIPLKKGTYELHLHFAETGLADFISAESSGEGQRVFRVSANGKIILDAFDVVADAAGANVSDERVFRDISPAADGVLHLAFSAMRGSPVVSGIEVLPSQPGKVRPIRIRAGWTTSWQDAGGRPWQSDAYFLGGNALVRTTNPARDSSPTQHDQAVYSSERWGHFSYALPLADGKYRLRLKFCEGHYGRRNSGVGGPGSRIFDVYSNGVALLRNFDIYKEAGGEGRPLDRVFAGMRPNAQGKLVLSFVPVVGMACVNAIEVEQE